MRRPGRSGSRRHLDPWLRPKGLRGPDPGKIAALAPVLAMLIGCTLVADKQRFPPNPAPLLVTRTVPEAGATGVDANVEIDVCLSALVDPRSVAPGDATVSSGSQQVDSRIDVQLVPWRGPGGEALPADATEPWCSGSVLSITPNAPLVGGVLYRMRLDPTAVGWAGEELDTQADGWIESQDNGIQYFLEFDVAAPPSSGSAPPPDSGGKPSEPHLTDLFAPGGVFDPDRGMCSCHTQTDKLAYAKLKLTDPATAFDGLVRPTRIRDTGFPMVSPRLPSESFLVHKLLHDPDGTAIRGVLGDPMPKGGRLPYLDLVSIIDWIEAGAEL